MCYNKDTEREVIKMKVKDLVKHFASNLTYEIRNKNNPNDVHWWGRGNNQNVAWAEEEISSIQHTSKKLIIYV